jgi:hypothetical protein
MSETDKVNSTTGIESVFAVDESVKAIELIKTPEQETSTKLALELVQGAMIKLNVEPVDYDLNKIHLINWFDYDKRFPQDTGDAFYSGFNSNIYIRSDDKMPKLEEFNTYLHELCHALSHSKHALEKIDDESFQLTKTRTGYGVDNAQKNHSHFLALNEAMTQWISERIMKDNEQKIKQELQVNNKELVHWHNVRDYYFPFMHVLWNIMIQLEKSSGTGSKEMDNKYMRGYFDGSMMHLRDIEKSFGPGSLKVFSALSFSTDGKEKLNLVRLVNEYFCCNNTQRKDEIAQKVLNNQDYVEYKYLNSK